MEKSREESKKSLASKKKELEDLEKKKKKEIDALEEKKNRELKSLENKRRELEELEKKKLKEIEYTDELIEKSFQELMRQKRKILEEGQENLENIAKNAPATEPPKNTDYGRTLEKENAPPRLYDVANRQVYTSLMDIRNRAANGEITEEDEQFIESVRINFERLGSVAKDEENTYAVREKNLLNQINDYIHR